MSLAAGKLRHRIEIQQRSEDRDSSGGLTLTWSKFADAWASIEPVSVREFVAAAAVQSKVTARIVIRYRPDLTPSMRVKHGALIYNIEGILPDQDSLREYLTLAVSAGVSKGA